MHAFCYISAKLGKFCTFLAINYLKSVVN